MGKVVTIDGPAASGKTSVSRELARRLGWKWVSTGAFYRGLAYVALQTHCTLDDENALTALARGTDWEVRMADENTQVFFKLKDVTDNIFAEDVGNVASRISHFPKLREALLLPQRNCQTQTSGLVAEGRDCGTVVFPAAEVKIYLTARQENRAERRAKDQGLEIENIVKQQSQRDHQDSSRKTAPLQVPESSYVVDTTHLNFQQVVDLLESYVRERI
jgi:cytidylate kinase